MKGFPQIYSLGGKENYCMALHAVLIMTSESYETPTFPGLSPIPFHPQPCLVSHPPMISEERSVLWTLARRVRLAEPQLWGRQLSMHVFHRFHSGAIFPPYTPYLILWNNKILLANIWGMVSPFAVTRTDN